MRAFASTYTPAERRAMDDRNHAENLARTLARVLDARARGHQIAWLVWDYSDSYHPYIDEAFDNYHAARRWAGSNSDLTVGMIRLWPTVNDADTDTLGTFPDDDELHTLFTRKEN